MACNIITAPSFSCPGRKLDLPFDFTVNTGSFTIMDITTFKMLIFKHYRYANS